MALHVVVHTGYPTAGYGYPQAPSGYGAPQQPQTVIVQQQPQRPTGGMGPGAGMAMGALGGLAAGLFIADIADGDLFD